MKSENNTNNTAGSDCQERLIMPSLLRIPLIEVFHQAGNPPFICGVNGHVTTAMLDEIEADIDDNAEYMLHEGDGTYLFKATRFYGQYGENGRCELAPCWELEMVLFSNDEAMRGGADEMKCPKCHGLGGYPKCPTCQNKLVVNDEADDRLAPSTTCSPSFDTPETDTLRQKLWGKGWSDSYMTMMTHANKLERERNDALSLIAAIRETASAPMAPPGPWDFSAENSEVRDRSGSGTPPQNQSP